jgi:hypothetical protein
MDGWGESAAPQCAVRSAQCAVLSAQGQCSVLGQEFPSFAGASVGVGVDWQIETTRGREGNVAPISKLGAT